MTAEKRERAAAAKDELRLRGLIEDVPPVAAQPNLDTDLQITEDLRRAREAMTYMNQREVDEDYTRRAEERDMRYHAEQYREHGMDR